MPFSFAWTGRRVAVTGTADQGRTPARRPGRGLGAGTASDSPPRLPRPRSASRFWVSAHHGTGRLTGHRRRHRPRLDTGVIGGQNHGGGLHDRLRQRWRSKNSSKSRTSWTRSVQSPRRRRPSLDRGQRRRVRRSAFADRSCDRRGAGPLPGDPGRWPNQALISGRLSANRLERLRDHDQDRRHVRRGCARRGRIDPRELHDDDRRRRQTRTSRARRRTVPTWTRTSPQRSRDPAACTSDVRRRASWADRRQRHVATGPRDRTGHRGRVHGDRVHRRRRPRPLVQGPDRAGFAGPRQPVEPAG